MLPRLSHDWDAILFVAPMRQPRRMPSSHPRLQQPHRTEMIRGRSKSQNRLLTQSPAFISSTQAMTPAPLSASSRGYNKKNPLTKRFMAVLKSKTRMRHNGAYVFYLLISNPWPIGTRGNHFALINKARAVTYHQQSITLNVLDIQSRKS